MKDSNEIVHLFWTGGWDSTFRLVQLLVTTDKMVQPHYIIRHEESTGIEINTMSSIQRKISRGYPDIRSRLLPTIFIDRGLIKKFEDEDSQIDELREHYKINEQYIIMAQYCRQFGINEIEVSLTSISGEMESFKYFKKVGLFNCFKYPLIDISKKEMLEIAKKNGWDELLNLTSFCRRPIVKIKPCGTCGPCHDAVISGLGYRLPLISRIKAYMLIPLRKYWRTNYSNNKNSFIFKHIEKKFKNRF